MEKFFFPLRHEGHKHPNCKRYVLAKGYSKGRRSKKQDECLFFKNQYRKQMKPWLGWMIYNTIREIESTFRILKTDLDLRPIYHRNDDSTMAHLHLGLLAYWLVNTIRYQLKQSGITDDWKEIKRKASTQKSVVTTA